MNIDDLTIGELKQLRAMMPTTTGASASPFIGQHCLTRTRSAGVHVGTVTAHAGGSVVLRNARRIWKWAGAFTCSELATAGLSPGESRMANMIPVMALEEAIELIPTTTTARETFEKCSE